MHFRGTRADERVLATGFIPTMGLQWIDRPGRYYINGAVVDVTRPQHVLAPWARPWMPDVQAFYEQRLAGVDIATAVAP